VVKRKDRGMIARGVAPYKRHNIVLDAEGGSMKSQQNAPDHRLHRL